MSMYQKKLVTVELDDNSDNSEWLGGYTIRFRFEDQIHGVCIHQDANKWAVANALQDLVQEIMRKPT